jgi:ABC-type glycerol-3-phosphate transport system permease component
MEMIKKVFVFINKGLFVFLVFIIIIWSLLPIYSLVLISITSDPGNFSTKLFEVPNKITLKHYWVILLNKNEWIWQYLVNSIIIATVVTVVVLIVSILAGYSFSRLRNFTSTLFFNLFLFIRMIPMITLIIPYYIIIARFSLLDTRLGIILAHIPWGIPLGIWLMKGFFDEVPSELEEAAEIDGASTARIIVQIMLPIVAPGIAVTGVFVFIGSYIEYLFALTLSRTFAITLPIRIAGYSSLHLIRYEQMAAATIIGAFFMVILIVFAQKYIVRGLTYGAIKG